MRYIQQYVAMASVNAPSANYLNVRVCNGAEDEWIPVFIHTGLTKSGRLKRFHRDRVWTAILKIRPTRVYLSFSMFPRPKHMNFTYVMDQTIRDDGSVPIMKTQTGLRIEMYAPGILESHKCTFSDFHGLRVRVITGDIESNTTAERPWTSGKYPIPPEFIAYFLTSGQPIPNVSQPIPLSVIQYVIDIRGGLTNTVPPGDHYPDFAMPDRLGNLRRPLWKK